MLRVELPEMMKKPEPLVVLFCNATIVQVSSELHHNVHFNNLERAAFAGCAKVQIPPSWQD